MSKIYTTQAIAEAIDGQLIGDGGIEISRLAHPADIHGIHDLVLAMDSRLLPLIEKNPPHAIVINDKADLNSDWGKARIVVKRPRLAMAKLTALFTVPVSVPAGIHPTAIIEAGAEIGKNVTIGAYSYIGSKAVIGANSVIHPQVYVGPEASIGHDALIYSGVRIGARVEIGHHCIIHFNSSIGSDGFSFVTPQLGSVESAKATGAIGDSTNEELVRIASLGTVIIGDDVEIGSNTSIDRGTIAATRIGTGTKIDNQVQVGHNVVIGENCLICGRAGIAGSAIIGNRVVLGGGTAVADHVKVGDDAVAMGLSGIGSNVVPRTIVGGIPAVPRERVMESLFNIGRLKKYMAKVDDLAEKLNALEQKTKSD